MAYDPTKMNKWSQGNALDCNQQWNYTDKGTAVATIVAANFFDPVNEANPSPIMNIGDLIWIIASDVLDGEFAVVTAITPHVTVSVFDVVLGAGAVGTNNLANGAVTAAKIGANVIGDGQVTAHALTSASLALNTIQYAQFPVTAAQLAAAYAAPLLLIAAPGAHELIILDNVVVEFDWNSAQYTAGGALSLEYGNHAHAAGVLATSTEAAATINAFVANNAFKLTSATTGLLANMINNAIYLSNDTAAFATGDSTLNINVSYHVVATTA